MQREREIYMCVPVEDTAEGDKEAHEDGDP
jgi:hypothetical protein